MTDKEMEELMHASQEEVKRRMREAMGSNFAEYNKHAEEVHDVCSQFKGMLEAIIKRAVLDFKALPHSETTHSIGCFAADMSKICVSSGLQLIALTLPKSGKTSFKTLATLCCHKVVNEVADLIEKIGGLDDDAS